MKKPEPTAEIVIKKLINANVLLITTHSEKAQKWIEEEAPTFGTLSLSLQAKSWRKYTLRIGDGYNIDQVETWLKSQGDNP